MGIYTNSELKVVIIFLALKSEHRILFLLIMPENFNNNVDFENEEDLPPYEQEARDFFY